MKNLPSDQPSPTPAAFPLLALLRDEIRSSGPLPFARFMELCLYHPELGYYNTPRPKLGAAGDFYTSAHAAPVFARLLAQHLERLWQHLARPAAFDIIELGPGDGLLASELLPWIEQRFPDFYLCLRYAAVEQSPPLRDLLAARLAPFASRTSILPSLPALRNLRNLRINPGPPVGCIFANEFFDALPVHILIWRNGWRERFVGLAGDGLAWIESAPSSAALAEQADAYFDPSLAPAERPSGWLAEIAPSAPEWIARIARHLACGQLLIVDYGYTLDEWRAGRFPEGSALAFRQHRASPDLLAHPGDQDLTAHVNFTHLADAALRAGLRPAPLQSQSKFLMELGERDEFADVFAGCAAEAERLRRAQLLKTLILPQGMGEAFRVLVLEKDA